MAIVEDYPIYRYMPASKDVGHVIVRGEVICSAIESEVKTADNTIDIKA
jgi:hypothetical protein